MDKFIFICFCVQSILLLVVYWVLSSWLLGLLNPVVMTAFTRMNAVVRACVSIMK